MVPVGGKMTLRIAHMRNPGSMPKSAATSSMRLIFICHSSDCGEPGLTRFFQFGLASPGPHQSEWVSFHSSQIFRECSVSRFSREKPWATANRSAPSPTSMTWPVWAITDLATCDTFLILRTPPTEPARRVGPCMQHESNSTTPSSFGKPPRPTLSSLGSSSGPFTTRRAASRVSPPFFRNAYASSR